MNAAVMNNIHQDSNITKPKLTLWQYWSSTLCR